MEQCADKNCPVHGSLSVRGNTFEGIVVSDKPKNTVIVKREYLHYVPKYERYERRRSKINAHKPGCMEVKTGDKVKIGECRKISKTKAFVVIENLGSKK
ncbi:MAG: 30S ribosomal protein S17 [Candidatus Micrarchaeota archaeon]